MSAASNADRPGTGELISGWREELAALIQDQDCNPDSVRAAAEELERRFEHCRMPEGVRMFVAIARGALMGPGDGWFGPAESRYNWEWLAGRHGIGVNDRLEATRFRGRPDLFARLDRNRDGAITAEDLDWSERNSWVQHAYVVNRLLRRLDTTGDGCLTRDEWQSFFDAISAGRTKVDLEELREAWIGGITSSFYPGDAPALEHLLRGLISGELGSLYEGPKLNDPAPDFTLKVFDGPRDSGDQPDSQLESPARAGAVIRLADMIGPRPVVLVFGNFTCSPFRSMYPAVEAAYRRFQNDATFVTVYVREAHPTDGWKMASNARVGVEVAQPASYDERTAVAGQFCRKLKPSLPLLVDEINDRVGHAYSGMPARLYVIDCAGKIAYKSGRGPFGFKVGEMEQALAMTLLDASSPKFQNG